MEKDENDLGIIKCCRNCLSDGILCPSTTKCTLANDLQYFIPSREACIARIKVLQEEIKYLTKSKNRLQKNKDML